MQTKAQQAAQRLLDRLKEALPTQGRADKQLIKEYIRKKYA